jgi:hypothetical protein
MALKIQATEIFSAGAGQVLSVMSDVKSWQTTDQPRLISAKGNKVTLAFDDNSRAVITFENNEAGSSAVILHELLKDDSQASARQTYWRGVLIQLHQRLDQK